MPRDSFYWAITIATDHGWRIEALDTKEPHEFLGKLQKTELSMEHLQLADRHAEFNAREAHWAKMIRDKKAMPTDIVVMHPDHVRGFLIETGIRGKNVIAIDRPQKLIIVRGFRRGRLDSRERRKLERKKIFGRKKR